MTKRSQHWLDEPQARGRKRTVGNWMHWQAPATMRDVADDSDSWEDLRIRARAHDGVIAKWSGNIDMAFAALEGPLQAFAGDTTDAKNSALWGVRRSDRPNSWANWKAYGVNPGVAPRIDTDEAGNVIGATWVDLWPGADLQIRNAGHKAEKRIIVKERDAPTHYEFTLKVAPGHDVVQVGDTLSIRDAKGVEQLRTSPPWAHDSATTGIGPDGHQYFAATLTRGADVKGLARYALDIKPEDLAGAVLPVVIDPDTTISGTTDIEDASMSNATAAYKDYNWGNYAWNFAGSVTQSYWCIYRIATAAIPAGTITSFRHRIFKGGYTTQTANVIYKAFDAGNNWVEGTGTGAAAQAGSCCYNYAQYNGIPWSAGAGNPHLSVRAEASYSQLDTYPNAAGAGEYFMDLTTAWASNWKSGTWENNGFLILELVGSRTLSEGYTHYPTENATPSNRPYFTISYVLGGAAAMLARRIHE